MLTAAGSVIAAVIPPGNSTSMAATTLSFAIKPLISEVTMRQSPSPIGASSGASAPDISASMLSEESAVKFIWVSKLCRNHTTIAAISMTLKALVRKSLAFSHSSCMTFFPLGSL